MLIYSKFINPMRILIIHNHYLEKGGEDEVVSSEIKMLKDFGHSIIFYERSNKEIVKLPFFKKLYFFANDIIWSQSVYKEVKEIVKKEKPDIAHIHNIFVSITPSVYDALSEENIPVVQTLHNYRLLCLNGLFYRDNKICQDCVKLNLIPSLIHRCYRKSFFLTLFLKRMLDFHFKKKTFQEKIDTYIVLSEFSKKKFTEADFPKDKIYVKPNFVDLKAEKRTMPGDYTLFIGRLINYKGINILITAYQRLKGYQLKIIGGGPLFDKLKKKTEKMNSIELLGRLSYEQTINYIKICKFLIVPSECYETFGRVIVEAFACGVPVVASNIGAIKEIVADGISGLLFNPGDIDDLSKKIKYLMGNNALIISMGEEARRVYEEKYTSEKNYTILMEIYKKTIENKKHNQWRRHDFKI